MTTLPPTRATEALVYLSSPAFPKFVLTQEGGWWRGGPDYQRNYLSVDKASWIGPEEWTVLNKGNQQTPFQAKTCPSFWEYFS